MKKFSATLVTYWIFWFPGFAVMLINILPMTERLLSLCFEAIVLDKRKGSRFSMNTTTTAIQHQIPIKLLELRRYQNLN